MWCSGNGLAIGQGKVGFWHMCFLSVSSHTHPLCERGYQERRSSEVKPQHEKYAEALLSWQVQMVLIFSLGSLNAVPLFPLVCTGKRNQGR